MLYAKRDNATQVAMLQIDLIGLNARLHKPRVVQLIRRENRSIRVYP